MGFKDMHQGKLIAEWAKSRQFAVDTNGYSVIIHVNGVWMKLDLSATHQDYFDWELHKLIAKTFREIGQAQVRNEIRTVLGISE